jgi:4'-phosphopantetheinyl transferase
MVDVYWLDQSDADLPTENTWLSSKELARLNSLRIPKRRADWRLGRWTAKRAVAAYLKMPGDVRTLAGLEIRPAPSGAPEVLITQEPAELTISLSHRAGAAMCAVGGPGVALGCDLEAIEPRSDAFVADYFTPYEQALVTQASAEDRAQVLTLVWSGKESTLKALHAGLRLDTRCLVVRPEGLDAASCGTNTNPLSAWHAMRVDCFDRRQFHGWWQRSGPLLRTLVAFPAPGVPVRLDVDG